MGIQPDAAQVRELASQLQPPALPGGWREEAEWQRRRCVAVHLQPAAVARGGVRQAGGACWSPDGAPVAAVAIRAERLGPEELGYFQQYKKAQKEAQAAHREAARERAAAEP